MKRPETKKPRVYTVGHSNRSLEEFLEILKSQKLKLVVDVRKMPKSRRHPHFAGEALAESLKEEGIEYRYFSELGGFRPARVQSVNAAWRNKSFRAYADYMHTEEFQKALARLIALSKRKRLVLLCAEAVPWRCHRSLIADSLIASGHPVEDIFSKTQAKPHKLPTFARVAAGRVTYPAEDHETDQKVHVAEYKGKHRAHQQLENR